MSKGIKYICVQNECESSMWIDQIIYGFVYIFIHFFLSHVYSNIIFFLKSMSIRWQNIKGYPIVSFPHFGEPLPNSIRFHCVWKKDNITLCKNMVIEFAAGSRWFILCWHVEDISWIPCHCCGISEWFLAMNVLLFCLLVHSSYGTSWIFLGNACHQSSGIDVLDCIVLRYAHSTPASRHMHI